jgi:hypothetical protein
MFRIESGRRPARSYLKRGLCETSRIMLCCMLVITGILFILPAAAYAQPSIITTALPSGQVGTIYYGTLTATGGTPPYTWSIVMGTLPSGLSLDPSSGSISGLPYTQGTFSFVVQILDSAAASSQQSCFITITSQPVIFMSSGVLQATEGAGYTATLSASGGTAPYTWYLVSGTLPSGLTLEPTTGTISGVPVRGTAGSTSFTVRVTDSSVPAVSAQQSFTLSIEKGSYEAVINIGSGLKSGQARVYANGQQLAMLYGGQSTKLSVDLGTSVTVSVDPTIQDPSDGQVRYKAEASEITVSEYSPYARFNYYPEYFVRLSTEPSGIGSTTGSGWYREGYTLTSSTPASIESGVNAGTQYRFSSWSLPNGQTVSDRNLNLSVSMAGTYIARYDTYYKLAFTSTYGEQKAGTWYKAGTQAQWNLSTTQVPMSGILGLFGGSWKAVDSSGVAYMNGPKNVVINWEPDYLLPAILIPAAVFLLILCLYGLFVLVRGPATRPAPSPTVYQPATQAYQPAPPQYQTVLPMFYPAPTTLPPPVAPYQTALPPLRKAIEAPEAVLVKVKEEVKEEPASTKISPKTRDRLMEQIGALLDKYETEIRATRQNPGLPPPGADAGQKRLTS